MKVQRELTAKGITRSLIIGLILLLACTDASRATYAQENSEQDKLQGPTLIQRGSGGLTLLSRSDVRQDLELTEEQSDAVQKLLGALPPRLRDLGLGSRDLTPNEKRQRLARFDEQLGVELESILLPHQQERLRQVEIQVRVQAANVSDEFVNEEVLAKLHITDSQLRKLQSIREEVDREYERQRIAIRERAQARFLAELTPEQRAQWKELVGAPFLAKERPMGQRAVPAKKSTRPAATAAN
jgi:hypothetical protein